MLNVELQAGPWRYHCLPVVIHLRESIHTQQIADIELMLQEEGQTPGAGHQTLVRLRLDGPFDPETFPLLLRAELCLPASTDTLTLRYPSQAQLRQTILRASSNYWLAAHIQTSDGQQHIIQRSVPGF